MTGSYVFLIIAVFCLVVGYVQKRWADHFVGHLNERKSWSQWLSRDDAAAMCEFTGIVMIGASVLFGVMAVVAAIVTFVL